MYYIYMVECRDGSLYTGVAADPARRLRQHIRQAAGCARYTRAHPVTALRGLWRTEEKGDALRLEYAIKGLTREEKLVLLERPDAVAERFPRLTARYEPVTDAMLEQCQEEFAR